MPIAQERMIALVNACKDYMGAIEGMKLEFDKSFRAIERAPLCDQPALVVTELNRLYSACEAKKLLGDYGQSYSTIQLENQHWAKTAKKNLRERKRLAKKRGKKATAALNAPQKMQFDPEANEGSFVARVNEEMDAEMDLDPKDLIGAGEGLDAEKKSELDKEVEEALKKMGGE